MVITLIDDAMRRINMAKKPLEVRNHKTMTGAECCRLVDCNNNPVCNISKSVARSLYNKGIIKGLPPQKPTSGKLF